MILSEVESCVPAAYPHFVAAKLGGHLSGRSFRYRVLVVDDDPLIRQMNQHFLEQQDYEVLTAEDGFEGLSALKRSPPDIIISDLEMPNMSGFEFLSVVRRRFPAIPVIVISGSFLGLSVPESVLADAFFSKGEYRPEDLLTKVTDLLDDLPTRPKAEKPKRAAVWVRSKKGIVVVTCTECLRTFPVSGLLTGMNQAECDFCSTLVSFEVVTTP